MRPLALLTLAAALAACTTLDQQLAQQCRDRGIADNTPEMSDCVQRLATQANAARPPTVPPTFGGRVGCYPSKNSGVVC
jgi:hypothetical protein